jgi:hypothetical protein
MVPLVPGVCFMRTRRRGVQGRRLGEALTRREIRLCGLTGRGRRIAFSAAFARDPANNRHVIDIIVFMSVSFEYPIVKLIFINLRPDSHPWATTISCRAQASRGRYAEYCLNDGFTY